MGKNQASVGQIWTASKAYMGSDAIQRYDGVIHQESVQNLGSFVRRKGLGDFKLDNDTRSYDRLDKYNIMQFTPIKRLGEIENMAEVYVITDEHGHDIGTYTVSEKGTEFKLNPKIAEKNAEVLAKITQDPSKSPAEIAYLRKEYDFSKPEAVIERLAKGEELVLANKEQADFEISKAHIAEQGKEGQLLDDEAAARDPETAKEQEALKKIPADMRGQVVEQCCEKGIRITEIMVVNDCRDVYDEMGNDGPKTVSPTGGPVIMVRTAGVTDKLYMFQKGQLLPNTDAHKDRMLEIMTQHRGSENLSDFEDHREDGVLDQMLAAVATYQKEMESYETAQFENDEEKLQCIAAAKKRLGQSLDDATKDYVPDSDGDVAALSKAIEEEVGEESREELIEQKMKENNVIENSEKDDDGEKVHDFYAGHDAPGPYFPR